MKRSLGSSDSLGAMMSIGPNSADSGEPDLVNNPMYTRSDFHTMLDGLDEEGMIIDESGNVHHHVPAEKKRRLSVNQVKALEKNFEVENKLEPERKVKLAQELGLQPRQVAVWFQNRRARWKTKQLERDYGVLKANYDGLKLNFEKLQRDNEALLKEVKELKEKVNSSEIEDGKSELSAKDQDVAVPVSDDQYSDDKKSNLEIQENIFLDPKCEEGVKIEILNDKNSADIDNNDNHILLCGDFKDGLSCDSDSSAILNEDNIIINNNSPNPAISSSPPQLILPIINVETNINFQISSSISFTKQSGDVHGHVLHDDCYDNYQPQLVKIEEQNFFGSHEEPCSTNYLFSDDQAPSLPWICSDEWS